MLSNERFEAPEILFNPNSIGLDLRQNGISEMISEMILKTLNVIYIYIFNNLGMSYWL